MKNQSTKRPPVIVNLIKLTTGGYVVEPDRKGGALKFSIPKSVIDAIHLPPNKPPQPIHPPVPPVQPQPQPTSANSHAMTPTPMIWMPTPQLIPPLSSQPPQSHCPAPPQPQPEIQPPDPPKRIAQKYQLIIPSCAAWFQLEQIHSIEKEAFPEFFNGQYSSKTPELYKKYRNFIVNLYKSQPNQYLTTTACRKVLAGDACTIARIHGFLQHWGIINYSIDPETCPNKILPQPALTKGLFRSLILNAKDELDMKGDLNQEELAFLNTLKAFTKNYRPLCDYCGIKCGLMWYQQKPLKDQKDKNKEVKEMTLCIKCYTSNNFPNILSSDDFDRTDIDTKFKNIDILKQPGKASLQQSEVLTVLQCFQDDPQMTWEKVAQCLNQKHDSAYSQEDIILHFLQYPLENIYNLEQILDSKENLEKLSISDIAQRIAFEEPHIFSDASNLVSFHLALFRRFLEKYVPPNQNGCQNASNHCQEEESKLNEDLNTDEIRRTIQLREETTQRAKLLQQREEEKINDHINLLISLQMEKLELKLAFVEEYEKLVMYEKTQLEMCQKQALAERLLILQQRLQLLQENNQ